MLKVYDTKTKEASSRGRALHEAAYGLLLYALHEEGQLRTVRDVSGLECLLAKGVHGKPYLPDVRFGDGSPLHFSLSHAGTHALCVIADFAVGADLQDARNMSAEQMRRIAGRFFSGAEQEAVSLLNDTALATYFYRVWAAKEAYVKWTGKGLAADFSLFTADPDAGVIRGVYPRLAYKAPSVEKNGDCFPVLARIMEIGIPDEEHFIAASVCMPDTVMQETSVLHARAIPAEFLFSP